MHDETETANDLEKKMRYFKCPWQPLHRESAKATDRGGTGRDSFVDADFSLALESQ